MDGYGLAPDCVTDALILTAPSGLDWSADNCATAWVNYVKNGDSHWCFDGYFRKSPANYIPSGENYYYCCAASYCIRGYLGRLSRCKEAPALIILSLDAMAQRAHRIKKTERPGAERLRLLQNKIQSCFRVLPHGIGNGVGQARERFSGHKLPAQRVGKALRLRRLRAVDRTPARVEQQKLVLRARRAAEQRPQLRFQHADGEIPDRRAVAVGQEHRRAQQRLVRVRRVLRRAAHQNACSGAGRLV